MGLWKEFQDSIHPIPSFARRNLHALPLHYSEKYYTHNASISSISSNETTTSSCDLPLIPFHAPHPRQRDVPRRLQPTLSRTNRFIYAHFRLILITLFASTLFAVTFSLFTMSTASARILHVHDDILSGRELVWLRFHKLQRYYAGLYTLVPVGMNMPEYPPPKTLPTENGRGELGALKKSRVFSPYPDYSSVEYASEWEGQYQACSFGAGRAVPEVRVFDGIPEGMPDPAVGSYGLLGLDDGVCFDRYGRLGGYGYGYTVKEGGLGEAVYDGGERENEVEGAHGVGGFPLKKVDWRGVDWGLLQRNCEVANRGRFVELVEGRLDQHLKPYQGPKKRKRIQEGNKNQGKKRHRTAILLRTWTGYRYTANDIANVRSLISELSLLSGGEYHVRILVHVKDKDRNIYASQAAQVDTLHSSGLPKEFWGIAELWNEPLMKSIYSKVPDQSDIWKNAKSLADDKLFMKLPAHGVYRSTFMPVQWFSQRHPEYEYVWNWEMDIRYTGHWYHLFSQLDQWTTKQPRQGLWERNSRFYVPYIHGAWEEFVNSTASLTNSTILGPVPVEGITPTLPHPPSGEGEPADLVTLNPLFDPQHTTWILRDDIIGYTPSTPRRSAIITGSRLSRRLLAAMHTENAENGRAMFSEMFPASVALHHGFKAVFAPHPVFVDRRWPVGFLEKTLNNGVNGFTGGRKESVFGTREHSFRGSTWYYNADFARQVYKGWATGRKGEEGEIDRLERSGRMCLKAMLVHPVKA